MPSNTAGGWPYPLPAEPTRDGAVNMKALADTSQARLNTVAVWAAYTVAAFDVNGLWYAAAWSAFGMQWDAIPTISASASTGSIGGDANVHVQVYRPHNSANGMVLQGAYVKDGRVFSGNLDVYVIAIGPGRYL